MAALANIAKFAKDSATGGFRELALAAFVTQSRAVIVNAAILDTDIQKVFAFAVVRSSPSWAEAAAWALASDPAISVSATLPTEAVINTACANAWPVLSKING